MPNSHAARQRINIDAWFEEQFLTHRGRFATASASE
jgi:hypothetical protein